MNEQNKHIVVGVDGSDEAHRALRWAGRLARDLHAEVVAVYALNPLGEFTLSLPPFPPRNLRREFRSQLEDRWCAPLRDLGVPYKAVIVESGPVRALLETCDKEQADLVVVGGHRHETFSDHVVGSVAARLVHRGTTPVIVVPPGVTTETREGQSASTQQRDRAATG
jgi:nucleotide-binding universal stress UspA family protein